MKIYKISKLLVQISVLIAISLHVLFDCYNPIGINSCESLTVLKNNQDLLKIIFSIIFFGFIFYMLQTLKYYLKFKGNDIKLLNGTDLDEENEEIREQYLRRGWLALIWGLCWFPIFIVLK